MRLYHFCEAKFALSNIEQRRLKVARISALNDPFELFAPDLRNSIQRRVFIRNKKEADRRFGLLCFSRGWHNPVLWSHYADKHKGICLAFDVADRLLMRVKYSARRLEVRRSGTETTMSEAEQVARDVLTTKGRDWMYEREMRVFVDLDFDTQQDGLFFSSFSEELQLREIIFGALCRVSLERVQTLVAGMKPPASVVQSRLAFKSFRVVEHRSATRRIRRRGTEAPRDRR